MPLTIGKGVGIVGALVILVGALAGIATGHFETFLETTVAGASVIYLGGQL